MFEKILVEFEYQQESESRNARQAAAMTHLTIPSTSQGISFEEKRNGSKSTVCYNELEN